jgi:hypothetical protein
MTICRRFGWPRGGPGCRAAPAQARRPCLVPPRVGTLPRQRHAARWDYPSRRDRRRTHRRGW